MKGETCKYPYKAEPPCDFNPCTHEGCDAEDTRIRDVVTDISIHAPMKGATDMTERKKTTSNISIHAPMKGATQLDYLQELVDKNFNPRTHEGCDKSMLSCVPPIVMDFNPRTHEGCDSLQINSVIACFSIIYIAN